jgi:hypothetical protein
MTADSLMKLVPPYEYRHPRVCARVRAGVGLWLLVLTVILLFSSSRSSLWAVLLVPAAALHFFLAFWLPRAISARTNSAGLREDES